MLTLDYQEATQRCEHCAKDYPVSRGSIYESGKPVAIYLAGLHPCSSGGSAIFAVGVAPEDPRGKAQSFSIQVWLVNDQYQMSLLDPEKSPWRTHGYLGPMMTRAQALASPRKAFYFELADCIVGSNPQVIEFFRGLSEPEPPPKRGWRKPRRRQRR
ncbi:MAG TPA: hypothetical protein VKL19_05345 [Thermoanaerobaculia bacterium]|nr:hypothetical protein [Thermoanaerobaculia bacterium]